MMRRIHGLPISCLVLLLITPPPAIGQERVDVRTISLPGPGFAAAGLAETLQLGAGATLSQVSIEVDDSTGMIFTRYQQEFQGLPVWGEEVRVARTAAGQVRRMSGTVVRNLAATEIRTVPEMSVAEVLEGRRDFVRGAAGRQDLEFVREIANLQIYFPDGGEPRLVYVVSFFVEQAPDTGGQPSWPTYLIDANTGEVVLSFEGLKTHGAAQAQAKGPGGNQKTARYEYGSDKPYLMVSRTSDTCQMATDTVHTFDLQHGSSAAQPYNFVCDTNTHKSINGAFAPLNDAHAFGQVVFDLYRDWVGADPLAPENLPLRLRVHYGNSYQDAFWNGATMTFGDGRDHFYPLVALDIVAHEVSHGFTEHNSGLIYFGESGAINEAFSDIAGEAAEHYLNQRNDFMVGWDVFKDPHRALRYMDDPTRDGKSIDHVQKYRVGMDVHHGSGVFNRAFYLLVNDHDWSVQDAFAVFARANRFYWTPSTDFERGAQGVVDAALDLGMVASDVGEAFRAVGIQTQ